jgi:hypothetical protein
MVATVTHPSVASSLTHSQIHMHRCTQQYTRGHICPLSFLDIVQYGMYFHCAISQILELTVALKI